MQKQARNTQTNYLYRWSEAKRRDRCAEIKIPTETFCPLHWLQVNIKRKTRLKIINSRHKTMNQTTNRHYSAREAFIKLCRCGKPEDSVTTGVGTGHLTLHHHRSVFSLLLRAERLQWRLDVSRVEKLCSGSHTVQRDATTLNPIRICQPRPLFTSHQPVRLTNPSDTGIKYYTAQKSHAHFYTHYIHERERY